MIRLNKNFKEEVLFFNIPGVTGNIELKNDVSNYNYIKIVFGETGATSEPQNTQVQEIPVINGKCYISPLNFILPNSNSSFMLQFSKEISITGKTLKVERTLKVDNNNKLNTSNETISIIKVVGIK